MPMEMRPTWPAKVGSASGVPAIFMRVNSWPMIFAVSNAWLPWAWS